MVIDPWSLVNVLESCSMPSGKRLRSELENHPAIHGKIHYFDWAMASIAILTSPEGNDAPPKRGAAH